MPPGTVTETLNVQLVPAVTVPPAKVSSVLPADPVRVEPTPQGGSGVGGSVAARPGRAAARLSVKEMPVASTVPLVLSRTNASVAVPAAITGSPLNALLNRRPVTRSESVAGLPVTARPETVAVGLELLLAWNPGRGSGRHVQA